MSRQQPELLPFANPDAIALPQGPAISSEDAVAALREPFAAYMASRQFAQNTMRSFLSDLDLLCEYAGPAARIDSLSTERLEQFLNYLEHERAAPCSDKSLDRRITTLKILFGWLAQYHVLPEDPSAPLVHRQLSARLPEVLHKPQIQEVLAVTQSMRDAVESPDARPHLLLTLLLATGIKKAECMRVELQQIDLSNTEQPTIFIAYDRPRQRHKERLLALPKEWVGTLEAYLGRYQPTTRLFECTPRNLEYVLHTISQIARLSTRMTFEMLRWTSALGCYRQGMAPDRLMRRLGLSPISWYQTQATLEILAHGPE